MRRIAKKAAWLVCLFLNRAPFLLQFQPREKCWIKLPNCPGLPCRTIALLLLPSCGLAATDGHWAHAYGYLSWGQHNHTPHATKRQTKYVLPPKNFRVLCMSFFTFPLCLSDLQCNKFQACYAYYFWPFFFTTFVLLYIIHYTSRATNFFLPIFTPQLLAIFYHHYPLAQKDTLPLSLSTLQRGHAHVCLLPPFPRRLDGGEKHYLSTT